ncbi:hypothetical protein PLEOSDRAFT_171658 [Pleurotus ostreatus PC15]|uniref:Aminoglycoside phosphotransferase domain-containing protein n=1 Tax=Pleurotus ostreatus (strain PC15) TaxID=1137138 RepID=A0A067N2H1_PLEO1|nr:hypothetical protein PLEOSDRAFT_171658 [Pleurotus ostreatus PC15]
MEYCTFFPLNIQEPKDREVSLLYKERGCEPVTQQQCHQEAERITGVSANPSTVQGGTIYTVVAGDYAVQFRDQLLGYAEAAYPEFVPHHQHAGKWEDLDVYLMTKIGGISMYLVGRAVCIATSSNSSIKVCGLQVSPQTLETLIARLPCLFADDWPMVPNLLDLLENNLHVDPGTGRLVGICDWRDVEISPFGISLCGLETMLGMDRMGRGCQSGGPPKRLPGGGFNQAMGEPRVEVARLVGIFLANGREYNEADEKVVVGP